MIVIGQGSAARLPRLDGVALEYELAGEHPTAVRLARTLTDLSIADPANWQHKVSRYLLDTLVQWVAQHGGEEFNQQFSLSATLRSTPTQYTSEDIEPERLYLVVEPTAAGYLAIGPTLDALKPFHSQLPATFYRLIIGSISTWVRVYTYSDAEERVEMWREWMQQEQEPGEYELPDVEASIPAELGAAPLTPVQLAKMTRSIQDQRIRRVLAGATELGRISRRVKPPKISEACERALIDSTPPLPALLVSFKPQDGIVATFDEEREAMLEAEPEPSFLAEMDPADPAGVRRAFNQLATLCETLAAASRLMALLP